MEPLHGETENMGICSSSYRDVLERERERERLKQREREREGTQESEQEGRDRVFVIKA